MGVHGITLLDIKRKTKETDLIIKLHHMKNSKASERMQKSLEGFT